MKAGWELRTLQQVSTIVNGGTPDTNVPEYWDGENLWITPKDMGKLNGRFVDDTFRKLTLSGLKNSSAKILPQYSLILSSRAPIGHLAINSKPISTNQGCKGIIPSDNLDTFYLYYFLLNSVEYLNSLGTGATFKELSGSKLGQVEIPLPPLPEQQRIVSILDDAFTAIDKAKVNAEKNLKNAKNLFESYLQGVFENKGEGWEEQSLGELATFSQGIQVGIEHHLMEPKLGYVRFIRIVDYTQNTDDIRYIPDPGDKYFVNEDDIVMVRYGTPGLIGRGKAGVIANNLFTINVKHKNLSNDFLCIFLSQKHIQTYLSTQGSSTMPALNFGQLKVVPVYYPSLEEQQKIVQKLDALSAETKRLESIYQKKLTDLEELKKSILQKAFNGELNTSYICA